MKQLFFALLTFCLASATAQTSGVVYFEEKVNLHRNLPPEAESMKAMIPEWNIVKSELLFTETESLYRNVEEEEEDEINNGGMVMKFQRPVAVFHRNFDTGIKTDFREFFGKRFLIVDSLKSIPWKLTGEMAKVLEYDCMSATWNDTTNERNLVAWFTDAIGIPGGPANFYGLPGVILKIDVNEGEQQMTATKVALRPIKTDEIEVPKKGDRMTDAEFNAYMDEKMKEYGVKGKGGKAVKMFRG